MSGSCLSCLLMWIFFPTLRGLLLVIHPWWFTLLWLSYQLLTYSIFHLSHFHFFHLLDCCSAPVVHCLVSVRPLCTLTACPSLLFCGLCPLSSMTDQFLHSRTHSLCLAAPPACLLDIRLGSLPCRMTYCRSSCLRWMRFHYCDGKPSANPKCTDVPC